MPRTALDMNAEVLWSVAECWVEIFDFEGCGNIPRTPPLKMIQPEAVVSLDVPQWTALANENHHPPNHITVPYPDRWPSFGRSCSKMISWEMDRPRRRCTRTVGGFGNLSPMRCGTCVKIGHPGHHGWIFRFQQKRMQVCYISKHDVVCWIREFFNTLILGMLWFSPI